MNLVNEMRVFKEKISSMGMPGWEDYAKKAPPPKGGPTTAFEELVLLGTEIRRAVNQDNEANFKIYTDYYNAIFSHLNTDLAVQTWNSRVRELVSFGISEMNANLDALQEIRNDREVGRKFLFWFPREIYARITVSQDITGHMQYGRR